MFSQIVTCHMCHINSKCSWLSQAAWASSINIKRKITTNRRFMAEVI
jgi:hypothetical protein